MQKGYSKSRNIVLLHIHIPNRKEGEMISETKKRWISFRGSLRALDEKSAALLRSIWQKLQRLDQWSVARWKKIKRWLDYLDQSGVDRIDEIVQDGGSKGLTKKRTGKIWLDWLSARLYNAFQLLDKLDTYLWFKGKPYQAKKCRVRSKAEKRVANFFTDQGIKFVYEKKLRLDRVTLHPDFYLPEFKVYVEYWGLADSDPDYDNTHRAKLRLYREHNIPIISIYPRHISNLRANFRTLFEQATGQKFPEKGGGG